LQTAAKKMNALRFISLLLRNKKSDCGFLFQRQTQREIFFLLKVNCIAVLVDFRHPEQFKLLRIKKSFFGAAPQTPLKTKIKYAAGCGGLKSDATYAKEDFPLRVCRFFYQDILRKGRSEKWQIIIFMDK